MKIVLIKKFIWTENGVTGVEENQVVGFEYSNMGEHLVIRWSLDEFKKQFPDEVITEVRPEYHKYY